MHHRRLLRMMAAATLMLVAGAHAVRADAIDGEWCDESGHHFVIKGPDIVTPQGTKTSGTYSRHAFSYAVPASDPSAGATIFMRLLNEETVHLRVGDDQAAPVQVWTRCKPIS